MATGLIVMSLVAVGGVGFAAFASSGYVGVNSTAGYINIEWGTLGIISYFGPTDTCTGTIASPTNLVVTASDLLPGDTCTYPVNLVNTGNLPGVVQDQISASTGTTAPSYCPEFFVQGGGSFSPASPIVTGATGSQTFTVPAGGSSPPFDLVIGLLGSASVSGATCGFTVTLTATAT